MTKQRGIVSHHDIGGGFVSKHRRRLVRVKRNGTVIELAQFNATKPLPWQAKRKRRAASRRARASRKANRAR